MKTFGLYFITPSLVIVITVRLLSLAQYCIEYLVIYVYKQNIFEIFIGCPKTPLTQNVSGNWKQPLNRRLTCWCAQNLARYFVEQLELFPVIVPKFKVLSKLLRPPRKNCLPSHLCLKTMLSTSGQPLRRRCLPKQNCSRTWIYTVRLQPPEILAQ